MVGRRRWCHNYVLVSVDLMEFDQTGTIAFTLEIIIMWLLGISESRARIANLRPMQIYINSVVYGISLIDYGVDLL